MSTTNDNVSANKKPAFDEWDTWDDTPINTTPTPNKTTPQTHRSLKEDAAAKDVSVYLTPSGPEASSEERVKSPQPVATSTPSMKGKLQVGTSGSDGGMLVGVR